MFQAASPSRYYMFLEGHDRTMIAIGFATHLEAKALGLQGSLSQSPLLNRKAADLSSMISAIPSPKKEDRQKHDHQSSHALCPCGPNRKKQEIHVIREELHVSLTEYIE